MAGGLGDETTRRVRLWGLVYGMGMSGFNWVDDDNVCELSEGIPISRVIIIKRGFLFLAATAAAAMMNETMETFLFLDEESSCVRLLISFVQKF